MPLYTPKTYTFLLVLLFAAIPIGVFGQDFFSAFGGNVSLTVIPEFPRANEKVTIEARGLSLDLNRAEISWSVNGTLMKKAIGGSSFSFETGSPGSSSSVVVTVRGLSGQLFRETLAFHPADVDILWNTHSYVPPFYKGKKLLTSQGDLALTAMPVFVAASGKTLAPETLVYTWKRGDQTLVSESGFGKQHITITGPLLFQDMFISLEVSSLDGSMKAEKIIRLEPSEPRILFYEKHPLRGVLYNHALQESYELSADELVLRAEPYFFSYNDIKDAGLEFLWSVNNENAFTRTINELVLRKEEGGGGQSRIGFEVRDAKKLLQSAAAILIHY